MIALVRPFLALCLWRIGPQHLPVSIILLTIALLAHTITESIGFAVLMPGHDALLAGLAATGLLAVLTVSILTVQKRQRRVIQTLTALAGAIALIDAIGIPVASWLQSAESNDGASAVPVFLLIIITGWSLATQGHILRHALSIPTGLGMMISLFFFWISYRVMHYLFPGALG